MMMTQRQIGPAFFGIFGKRWMKSLFVGNAVLLVTLFGRVFDLT
ncbi:Hypothetical protein LRC_02190 [Ligilactobacillus ruminis ATCC 27782]|uniref:Uncharacterized protein n=2 Tax=Ligilactobacillus ruminis TaxID=1623 RepID=G2SQJ7_LIGR2|nr:Hypothetical protein LRC_02190 [Ligilactobacillus ruminis ATCC 27782]KLA45719.1 hypothetical protein LRB_1320 [Ligilactobacillus ruminis]